MRGKGMLYLLPALLLGLLLASCRGESPPAPGSTQPPPPSASADGQPAPAETPEAAPPEQPPEDGLLRLGLSGGLPALGAGELVVRREREGEDFPYLLTLGHETGLADDLLSGRLSAALLSPSKGLELYHRSGGTLHIVAALTTELPTERAMLTALGLPAEGAEGETAAVLSVLVASDPLIREQSAQLALLLGDWERGLERALSQPDRAGEELAGLGLWQDGPTAVRLLERCPLTLLRGRAMAATLTPFYEWLFRSDPAALPGGLPDDGIYYIF